MGGAHAGQLYVERTSPVHALAPQVKVAAALVAVFAVVATPRTAIWAFAADAAIVTIVIFFARLPVTTVVRRLAIELPFLLGALLLPFVSRGERVDVLGVSLSESGLWAAWNIVAKGTLGAAIAGVLVATTRVPDLLGGLHRLRVPRLIVSIAGFTVRYAEVLADDLQRRRVARLARGDDPRWLWQARSVATGAGTLFVRAFERGERVHLAMLARGHDPNVPMYDARHTTGHEIAIAALLPAGATVVALLAWSVS
jgi:cobalt/nickel transport system permease protein